MFGGRPRPVSSPSHPKWRDWSNLGNGPAGLIAERLLADDVADYIRFRAVCCPWRQCSMDLRAHGVLDRRFHPRKWIMLREAVAAPHHRRFLNVSTGQCIRMHLPDLRGHDVFGPTTEGLLVLLDRTSFVVRLLNPLTGQLTNLPPATTLLHLTPHLNREMPSNSDLRDAFQVSDAGLADDSTFAVFFGEIQILPVAKPGDECWTMVDQRYLWSSVSFEGRFYCTTKGAIKVVETSANQPPRLVVAAKLTKLFSQIAGTVHLVDNDGELTLVYRLLREDDEGKNIMKYQVYLVDLNAKKTKPVYGSGGRALFIGLRRALSVSPSLFPSIKNDSIYLGMDDMLGISYESSTPYNFVDGTTKRGFVEECEALDDDGQFGPWGIDDYLSCYVTGSRDDSEDS